MIIEVNPSPDSYGDFSCPLQGDCGNCQALERSPTNFCPDTGEDSEGNFLERAPRKCPLRKGTIEIRLSAVDRETIFADEHRQELTILTVRKG